MSTLMDLIKKKKGDIQARGRRDKAVNPPTGKSRWRILPGWREGDETFTQDFGQHFVKDGAGSVKAVYTCDYVTHGEKCEVCDLIAKSAQVAGSDAELKMIDQMKAARKVLVNAYAYDGEHAGKVVVLSLTNKVVETILAAMENYLEEAEENPLDLKKGMDFIIEKSGAGLDTKYQVTTAAKHRQLEDHVLAQITDLDTYVKDSDEGKTRALAAIGAITGVSAAPALSGPSASARGALTGPSGKGKAAAPTIDAEIDDEIPWDGGEKEAAKKAGAAKKPADEEFNAPIGGDEDIDAMLAELD